LWIPKRCRMPITGNRQREILRTGCQLVLRYSKE
jgi:hypothetical protein